VEPDLVFEDSVGTAPTRGSLADDVLRACAAEDRELWDEICQYPRGEIVEAVDLLRSLGWKFRWVVLQ